MRVERIPITNLQSKTIYTQSEEMTGPSVKPERSMYSERPAQVVLISTYELGRQPFGLASPAAWLRHEGMEVTCADLAVEELPEQAVRTADVVAFYVPMHTATRLAIPLIHKVRELNPQVHICFYGLYAPVNEKYLRRLGVETILGGGV